MSGDNFAPAVMMKLMKEIRNLHDNPIEGITVSCTASPQPSCFTHLAPPHRSPSCRPFSPCFLLSSQLLVSDDSLTSLHAELDGPIGTPFEGGRFRIRLSLPADYPQCPPKGFFLTKVFHPNVSSLGEICVNTLKKDWKATHGLRHVLLVIHCLLIQPNPESALNEEAGKLLMEAYEEYEKRARLMTKIHATVKTKEAKVAPSSSSSPLPASSSPSPAPVSASPTPSAAKAKREGGNAEGVAAASAAEGEADEDVGGQENTPFTHVNSPNNARASGVAAAGEGKRVEKGEEECKTSPKKRAVVLVKGASDNKPKAIKKSIRRL